MQLLIFLLLVYLVLVEVDEVMLMMSDVFDGGFWMIWWSKIAEITMSSPSSIYHTITNMAKVSSRKCLYALFAVYSPKKYNV